MATHSNFIAWSIPWTEEPGRLQSIGLQSGTQLSNQTTRTDSCLATESSLSSSQRLSNTPVNIMVGFLCICFLSAITGCSRHILCISFPSHRTSLFSKESQSPLLKYNILETRSGRFGFKTSKVFLIHIDIFYFKNLYEFPLGSLFFL